MTNRFFRFMLAGVTGLALMVMVASYNTANASYVVPSMHQNTPAFEEENQTPTPTPTATPNGYGHCGVTGCG